MLPGDIRHWFASVQSTESKSGPSTLPGSASSVTTPSPALPPVPVPRPRRVRFAPEAKLTSVRRIDRVVRCRGCRAYLVPYLGGRDPDGNLLEQFQCRVCHLPGWCVVCVGIECDECQQTACVRCIDMDEEEAQCRKCWEVCSGCRDPVPTAKAHPCTHCMRYSCDRCNTRCSHCGRDMCRGCGIRCVGCEDRICPSTCFPCLQTLPGSDTEPDVA